jgi:hypothetical protein
LVLERGDKHESVKAFSTLSAWTEAEEGVPCVCLCFNAADYHVGRAGIELFASRREALAFINNVPDESGLDERVPLKLTGSELLRWIAKTETTFVDAHELRVDGSAIDFERALRTLLGTHTPRGVR